jgi:magnesium-transporting ATPase (P-type)
MSTISTLPGGKTIVSVKGAPETIKGMLSSVPGGYDETYKWFTRRGSRVLALGIKEMDALAVDKVLFEISFTKWHSHRQMSRSTNLLESKPKVT